jgi:hypothetical protein
MESQQLQSPNQQQCDSSRICIFTNTEEEVDEVLDRGAKGMVVDNKS